MAAVAVFLLKNMTLLLNKKGLLHNQETERATVFCIHKKSRPQRVCSRVLLTYD